MIANIARSREETNQKNVKEIARKAKEMKNDSNKNGELKKNFYILGYSMVGKMNGFLFPKKIWYKHLVDLCSFLGVKFSPSPDNVNLNLSNVKPEQRIQYAGTNDIKSEKTASQFVKSVVD